MKVKLSKIGALLLVTVISFIAGAALFVYFGIYNISALKQHTMPVYNLLEYAMRRSVLVRADEIKVPDLTGKERIRSGAMHYQGHCLQCHGAPGVAPHALAFGMTPEPVNLVSTAREWEPDQIYWVIKHGIKMSGMPAWKNRLSDEEMWDIVAFIEAMVYMSPIEYAALRKELPQTHAHGKTHGAAGTIGNAVAPSAAASMPAPTPADDPNPTSLIGNKKVGRQLIGQYLCATCHEIPGVTGASRHVGPPLNGIANRRYIAGVIVNNPENMVRWLMNPQQIDPLSAMPDLGVNEQDARDMAAYLYTLDDIK